MRIKIRMKRPAFITLFKISAVGAFGYVFAFLCICGALAISDAARGEFNFQSANIVPAIFAIIASPLVLGFVFGLSGWIFWVLYSRFRKSTIVLHLDSMKDIEEDQETANNSTPNP